jgi:hypothetical protein
MVSVVCRGDQEDHIRALVLQGLTVGGLRLRRLDSANIERTRSSPLSTVSSLELLAGIDHPYERKMQFAKLSSGKVGVIDCAIRARAPTAMRLSR